MLLRDRLDLDEVAAINDVLLTKAVNEHRAHEAAMLKAKQKGQ